MCGNEACESDFAPARQLDSMLEAAAEKSSPAEFGSRYLEAAAQRAIDGDFEEVRARTESIAVRCVRCKAWCRWGRVGVMCVVGQ